MHRTSPIPSWDTRAGRVVIVAPARVVGLQRHRSLRDELGAVGLLQGLVRLVLSEQLLGRPDCCQPASVVHPLLEPASVVLALEVDRNGLIRLPELVLSSERRSEQESSSEHVGGSVEKMYKQVFSK